jgi:hypothetical protein
MGLMSCTTTFIVTALYIVACILALTGIALTVSVYSKDTKQGVGIIETRLVIGHRLPDDKFPGACGYAGPILIGLSVVIGFAGNLVWLFSS